MIFNPKKFRLNNGGELACNFKNFPISAKKGERGLSMKSTILLKTSLTLLEAIILPILSGSTFINRFVSKNLFGSILIANACLLLRDISIEMYEISPEMFKISTNIFDFNKNVREFIRSVRNFNPCA